MTPFSLESRKEIGKRERWTCCQCGRSFHEGWMVDASHIDHEHNDSYDDPNNGEIRCLICHLEYHIDLMQQLDNNWSIQSVRLIASRAYQNGLHTYKETTEETLCDDRNEVVTILQNYGLDTDYFLY